MSSARQAPDSGENHRDKRADADGALPVAHVIGDMRLHLVERRIVLFARLTIRSGIFVGIFLDLRQNAHWI